MNASEDKPNMKAKNIKHKNIYEIIKNNLCTICGICEAVCPADCIEFEWMSSSVEPKVNFDRCIKCGRCYQVCPGKKIESQTNNIGWYEKYLGKIDESFIIVGAEKFKNKYTASGAFVTSFLSYLLDTKKINGVIAVSLEGNDFKNAKSVIIEDFSNLRKTTGSIYFSVPLGKGLKELFNREGKFAVVGLPCQIRGINNLIEQSEEYREKIFIKIGLFCGFMIGYNATKYLLDSLKIPNHVDIKKMSFRATKGDEEGFLVETLDEDYFISKDQYMSLLNRTFSNKRCLMCNDMTNEYADVSCGDAHKFGLKKSLIISRDKRTTKLIREAEKAGHLKTVKKIDKKDVFTSQKSILQYKKETIDARLKIMRLINGETPEFKADSLLKNNFFQKIGSLLYIINCYLTSNRITRKMFFLIPNKLIKIYGSFVYDLLQGKMPLSLVSRINTFLKR